jgi:hypothetical protein
MLVVKSILRPAETELIARIMKNLTDAPNDHRYRSIPLESRQIKTLSGEGLSVLLENGFIVIDRHLVYIV